MRRELPKLLVLATVLVLCIALFASVWRHQRDRAAGAEGVAAIRSAGATEAPSVPAAKAARIRTAEAAALEARFRPQPPPAPLAPAPIPVSFARRLQGPEPAWLAEGTVADAATGAPVAGAEVEYLVAEFHADRPETLRATARTQTDARGRFSLRGKVAWLPLDGPSRNFVRVRASGRADALWHLPAGPRMATYLQHRFALEQADGTLRGRVADAAGRGAPEARIRVATADARTSGALAMEALSGADGTFALGPFRSGETLLVAAESAEGASPTQAFRVGTGEAAIVLEAPPRTLRGRVLADGKPDAPVAGVLVELALGDASLIRQTDGEGRFAFGTVPSGSGGEIFVRAGAGRMLAFDLRDEAGAMLETSPGLGTFADGDHRTIMIGIDAPWSIHALATDVRTGAPVAGVELSEAGSDATARTGEDGTAELAGMLGGAVSVLVRAPQGFRHLDSGDLATRDVTRADAARPLEIALVRAERLDGVVVRADGTAAGEGIAVSITEPEVAHEPVFTDPQGAFALWVDPKWNVAVSARGRGEAGTARSLPIGSGEPRAPLRIVLGALGSIRGTVRGPGGVPQGGMAVAADDGKGTDSGAVSSPDGSYVLEGLVAGRYRLVALPSAANRRFVPPRDGARTVALDVGEALEGVDLPVEPAHAIEGKVVDPEGFPVEGAIVNFIAGREVLARIGARYGLSSVTTDEQGAFRVEGLRAGGSKEPYGDIAGTLNVGKVGYAFAQAPVEQVPGPPVTLVLKPSRILRVSVRDRATGDLVANFKRPELWEQDRGRWVQHGPGDNPVEHLLEDPEREVMLSAVETDASGRATGREGRVRVTAGVQDFDLWIEDAEIIEGRVVLDDPKGEPAPGAKVSFVPQSSSGLLGTLPIIVADEDGRFRFSLPQRTPIGVQAEWQGFRQKTPTLVIGGDDDRDDLVLVLTATTTLRGRVADEAGEGVPGLEVTTGPGAWRPATRATTDGDGRFEMMSLMPKSPAPWTVKLSVFDRLASPREPVIEEDVPFGPDAPEAELRYRVPTSVVVTVTVGGAPPDADLVRELLISEDGIIRDTVRRGEAYRRELVQRTGGVDGIQVLAVVSIPAEEIEHPLTERTVDLRLGSLVATVDNQRAIPTASGTYRHPLVRYERLDGEGSGPVLHASPRQATTKEVRWIPAGRYRLVADIIANHKVTETVPLGEFAVTEGAVTRLDVVIPPGS